MRTSVERQNVCVDSLSVSSAEVADELRRRFLGTDASLYLPSQHILTRKLCRAKRIAKTYAKEPPTPGDLGEDGVDAFDVKGRRWLRAVHPTRFHRLYATATGLRALAARGGQLAADGLMGSQHRCVPLK